MRVRASGRVEVERVNVKVIRVFNIIRGIYKLGYFSIFNLYRSGRVCIIPTPDSNSL